MNFKYLILSFFCLVLLKTNPLLAQCPVAANCTPGSAPSANLIFGMGIFTVTVNGVSSLTNTTSGAADGYKDYSCTKQATVKEGIGTAISVTTNPNVNENVRMWLDLNNNGTFETTELLFSSTNAKLHTGTFTIPVAASVVKNTLLRMRIAADNFSSALPTACSTPVYSQTEDYSITIVPNTSKPAVDFSVNNPITCSPTVQFQDLTQNGVTSYFWNFGDNTTSTAANPSHTYAATGTYTVRLKVCNANGCDSLTKTNYVTYHTNVPVAAGCTPATVNYCCGYGITKVTFGTLVNTSQDASAGFEDFTCTKSVTVQEGVSYPISLLTSATNQQDTWIYIDYNNNGSFEASELTFTKLNSINPGGNIIIQGGGVKNIPLRMRIISDFVGTTSDPCINRTGQAEDYTIIITPNTQKPGTAFTSNYVAACDTIVQFTDGSLNVPTSWLWDFGDGSPKSTLRNPLHKYNAIGVYSVKLKTCNAFGCDSLTKTNYITIATPCQPYCIPNNMNNNFYISKVTFNTINNTTVAATNGYANYTMVGALNTTVVKGTSYPISLTTNGNGTRNIAIWIDFNQNGDFTDAGEQVYTASGNTALSTGTITIPSTARTGITRMRVMAAASPNTPTPCLINQRQVEAEDYGLNISSVSGLINSELNNAIRLYPNPNHGTFSLEIPNVFGKNCALEVQNLVGQTVAKPQLNAEQTINQVDLSKLPKGIYLLKIYNSEVSAIKKIIIE